MKGQTDDLVEFLGDREDSSEGDVWFLTEGVERGVGRSGGEPRITPDGKVDEKDGKRPDVVGSGGIGRVEVRVEAFEIAVRTF